VAGRASRAVARKRSRPASQARTMASRCGGTPVEESQRTRVTTARAICRAIPAWRRSSSSIKPRGSRGAFRADLDLGANLAMGRIYRSVSSFGLRVEVTVKTLLTPCLGGRYSARRRTGAPREGGWGGGGVTRRIGPKGVDRLAVLLDEVQHPPPRVVGRV